MADIRFYFNAGCKRKITELSPPKIITKKQKNDESTHTNRQTDEDETYRYRFDVMRFVGKRLSDDEKYELLNNVFVPDESYSFPFSTFGQAKRSFRSSWLKQYPGLVYSPSQDGAFCLACVVFSTDIQARGQLVKEPFKNWKKATERFDEHFHNKRHNSGDTSTSRKTGTGNKIHGDCVLRRDDCIRYMKGDSVSVEAANDKGLNDRKEKNMRTLETIVETVLLCGHQNIPMRGNDDTDSLESITTKNTGNFRALLKYRMNGVDVTLEEHFKTAPKNATYKSKTIQNELVQIIGQNILQHITEQIKDSGGWFSISADEVRDISNQEQLAVILRYVDKEDTIQEDFVGFLDVIDGTDGENLTMKILGLVEKLHLDPNKMRSQCYDGAGNMSGKTKGVSSRIQRQFPKALPMWCAAHRLNPCVVQACTIPEVRNMMSTADQVVTFFEWGPHKQQKLETNIEKLTTGTKKTKLKELCRTRWVERHDAFEVFIDFLPAIVETLEEYSQITSTRKPGMPSASDLLNAILKFDFLVTLVAVHKCLSYLKGLSKALQDSGLEITKAMKHISVVKDSLNDCWSDIDNFHNSLHEKASKLAEQFDVEVKVPRICKRQTKRNNIPISDPNSYYRIAITTKFVDHLLTEMNERFTDTHSQAAMSVKLVPGLMAEMPCLSDFDFFKDDVESFDMLETEVHQWYRQWINQKEKPTTIVSTLAQCDEHFYPNIKTILRICGCFPVTSCECERSISILRLLKTYLRSTMGQERLSGLALMYIHRNFKVNIQDICKEFARRKPRRLVLPDILTDETD